MRNTTWIRLLIAVLVACAATFLLVSCSQKNDPAYQGEVKALVSKLEKAIAAKDLVRFSDLTSRADAVKLGRIFGLVTSSFTPDNPEYPVVSFKPIEFSPETIALGHQGEIKVKVAIIYNGKIGAIKDLSQELSESLLKIVNMGLPTEADLYIEHRDGAYKLKDFGFSPLYSLVMKGLELLL